jgi:hypothetical protein
MNITDEQLMAYADGELDEAARAEIAAAIASDPALADRVQAHEAMRARLQSAFAPVLDERIPDRLIAAVNAAPPREEVTDLQQARARKQERHRWPWSWPEWGAIAASLVLGLLIGKTALDSSETIVADEGNLIASGALADALENALSDQQGEHRIALSFRSNEGDYCRAFVSGVEAQTAGLACRTGADWRIRTLSEVHAQSTPYEQASAALPASVLATIDAHIEGEPLTVEEERAARSAGW